MSATTKILFLGATGYIGGTVLDAVLKHPNAAQFDITAYVRSEEKAQKVRALGLKAISGTLTAVEEAASQSEVIFNCASSDDLPLTEALLAGAKEAFASTNVPPIIIHTSGSAIVADDSMGEYASEKIWDDSDEALSALPATTIHRHVDIPLANAHKEGYVRTYIIAPPLVYGLASGTFVDAEVQSPIPTFLTLISKIAFERGSCGMVGPGKNIWTTVELHDLTRFYIILFDAVIGRKDILGGSAYYIPVDSEVVTGEYLRLVAQYLHEFAALPTGEVTPATQDDLAKWPILVAFGINSRVSGSRALSIGWKPTHGQGDFVKGLKETVELYSKHRKN